MLLPFFYSCHPSSDMVRLLSFTDLAAGSETATQQTICLDSCLLRNAARVSDRLLGAPGWRHWASPILNYEPIDVGRLAGNSSGVVKGVSLGAPLALMETLSNAAWTTADTLPLDDARLQIGAIVKQLQSSFVAHCSLTCDSLRLCAISGLPILAHFTQAIDIRCFSKLGNDSARMHLLAIWGETTTHRHCWTFDMHVLLELAERPSTPLHQTRLDEIRECYLTHHPLLESGERAYLTHLEEGWCQTRDKYEGKCWDSEWREIVGRWREWDGFALLVLFTQI